MSRNMDRWLGDGGMELLAALGVDLTGYEEGTVRGTWTPTPLACNPNGPVQGGTFGAVLDALMTFATLSALDRGESCTSLEMKISWLRGAGDGDDLTLEGRVVRIARKVAFCEAIVSGDGGDVVATATGTQLLRRRSDS
ncbi:MAG: PaaI family thioesterase [Acidimicrobiia bacterium]|nr:PaaI family thioesterase [Acidimicrobiia bacterium]